MDTLRFYVDYYKSCTEDRFEEPKARTKEHGLGGL